MNRYTQISPSAYSPMSMQEIMMVPLAMREQHNKTEQTLDLYNQELQKIKALPVHTPEAMERKNYLISKIDSLASDLSNKGFSNDMTSNLIKLNREIKDDFSPTGRLGKISGAYDTYFKEMEAFKKDNADKTWSQDEFNRHWNDHINNYQGYDEKGDVININSLSAPTKRTIQDEWKDLASITGNAKLSSEIIEGKAWIEPGPDGSTAVIHTKEGGKLAYNNPQVVAGLMQIQNKLNDPTSDLSKSRLYAGQSLEAALNEAYNIGKSRIDIETKQEKDRNISLSGVRNSLDAADQEGSLSLLDTTQTADDYEGTIGNAIATINKYTTTPPKTNDERLEYYHALRQKTQFDENIKDINVGDKLTKGNGKTLAKHYASELGFASGTRVNFKQVEKYYNDAANKFLGKYKKGTPEYEVAEKLIKNMPNDLTKAGLSSVFNGMVPSSQEQKVINDYGKSVQKKASVYHNYKNDIFKASNTYSANYTPHFEGKEDSNAKAAFKDLNEKLTNSLSDMISSPQGGAFISDISTENGKNLRLTNKNIVGKRENINKYILNNAKDVELVSFSDTGGKGVLPSVRLKINLKDDAESGVNIDGMFGDGEMGGKSMYINMVVPDVTSIKQGNMGTNSIYQQIFNAVGKYGDLPAKTIATSANQRQRKYGE